jgi:Asp-tRNA(Asn)/Glu-tRNA(Gln) amidotransferase A subunit family amidase
VEQAWPNVFRTARFIPAVEYIQANRLRTQLMDAFDQAIKDVDVYVHPTYGGSTLVATNLTGHPSLVIPNGLRDNGTQSSICFTGQLWGEGALVALAGAYQRRTGYHRLIPPIKPVPAANENN